jgi:hypothetical protein
MAHFNNGVAEALRLLKKDGLFFGTFPLRYEPRKGHPVALDVLHIEKALSEMSLIRSFQVQEPFYKDRIFFVVAKKCV